MPEEAKTMSSLFPMPYLRGWRLHAIMSQQDLAEAASVPKLTIARIETGKVTGVRSATVRKLAAGLGITPYELLHRNPPAVQATFSE